MSRTIEKVVPATKNGPINRLIGTVDIDGKGTTHSLPEVDPFILLDQATIEKNEMPPFGAHPHRGHSVVTILMRGKVKSWDSFSKDPHKTTTIAAPASYWVDAGSGLFHDEKSVIEDESDPSQHMSLFQLWIGVRDEDRKKAPKLQYDDNLPEKDCVHNGQVVGKILYFVGGGGGGEKTSIKTPHPITVAYIKQNANTTYHFPIDPSHGGFVVNLNHGSSGMLLESGNADSPACFGGTSPDNPNDVLVLSNNNTSGTTTQQATTSSSFLEITTAENSSADYLICVGERMQEPWAKKLVASGAVIAATPEQARDIASQVETYAAAGKSQGGSFAPFGV